MCLVADILSNLVLFTISVIGLSKFISNLPNKLFKRLLAMNFVEYDKTNKKLAWYNDGCKKNTNILINSNDINLVVRYLSYIIFNDFGKIRKLTKYLKNIASICNALDLPITWNVSSGLKIR